MYLKSLTIQGFKSFPDRTVLQFGEDITAIVGPNGSGKSNLSDAIRWVMGEQSTKALRGGKMEDVIFGGTQKRSAVGFAEATLVLDNSDGSFPNESEEIAVTRRYFRSGDSEYYINRRTARLRDINELFMDTGLGREGYSNISQGRIDEILSLRSVDRREIFEEAAGISKYRHRKEETERRLASTMDNLTRIGDKITELELQVEPMRVQAEKARKYLAYRSELKGLEVAVWLEALERLAAAAKKAEEDYHSAAFILQQSHEELDRLYALAEELGERLRAKDMQAEAERANISELQASTRELNAKIAAIEQNQEHNRQTIARIERELQEEGGRSDTISAQVAGHEARIAEITQQSAEIEAQIADLQQRSHTLSGSADELTRSYLHWSETRTRLMDELSAQRAEQAATEQSLSLSVSRMEEIDAQALLAQARLSEEEQKADACRQALTQEQNSVSAEKNHIDGYALRLQSRAQKRDALQARCTQLSLRLQTAQSQQRMYQEMQRDYDGYSKAVKYTMQQAKNGALRGIHGPVSTLIHSADAHTVAIEIAMGATMQYIVVSDEAASKAAIESLKRSDRGRNTFYPLTTMRGRRITELGLSEEPGFVGIASDLVDYDPQYEQIILHILGRTVVVERLDDAIAISRRYGRRFRLVTLDGQVVNADSSMTGGSAARNAGILSRANELARLTAQIADDTARLSQEQKAKTAADSDAAQAEYQLTCAKDALRQAEDAVLKLEGELRQHEVLLSAIRDALDANTQERDALTQRQQLDENRLTGLCAEIRQLERRMTEAGNQLSEISIHQNQALAKVQELSDQITRCRVASAALTAERSSCVASRDHLKELSAAMAGDRGQKQALISRLCDENQACEAKIAEGRAAAAQTDETLAAATAALQSLLSQHAATEAEKTKAEREAQEKSRDILNMEREAARLEQKKLSAELEEKQIVDKLWDGYELTRTNASEAASPIESVAGAQRSIAELKRKISALGEPNPGVIAQFELLNERYQYLCAQRDDVLHAKQELEGVIKAISDQMEEIFNTEFSKINTFFAQTFTEMFGGGKGTLVLEDPSQPLSCGIEIRVQPPGKQLKTITLLSGGEKAFVAIALYFAILKVRPTPFCMLDEIDAALDDRNVERFASYLRTLCRKTQFIVITHRRGTMEQADILYGVTMQERGVSKILSLDLKQMVETMGITE